MDDSQEKNKYVQILVVVMMVICICIASFFSGYYLQNVNSVNACNEFINENYLIPLKELNNNTQQFQNIKLNISIGET